MKKAILIDGNSLAYRAYFATWKQVEYAKQNNLPFNNAIRTMLLMCWNLIKANVYQYGIVSFDTKAPTFRDQIYEGYKQKRVKTPVELLVQIPLIKQALVYLGFLVCEKDGFEADDLIGSYANLFTKQEIAVDIYSSDRDMLQLVNAFTNVFLCIKGTKEMVMYNNENFKSLFYGLAPYQVVEYKGLVGDNSDNLAGIKGIGPIKGIELLQQYGTIDNIYTNFNNLPNQLQKLLNNQKEIAKTFSFLAKIKTDIELDQNIDLTGLKPIQKQALIQLLSENKINTLVEKFSKI